MVTADKETKKSSSKRIESLTLLVEEELPSKETKKSSSKRIESSEGIQG